MVARPRRCCIAVLAGVLLSSCIAVIMPAAIAVLAVVFAAMSADLAYRAMCPIVEAWLWWLVLPHCVHEWMHILALSARGGSQTLETQVMCYRISVRPTESVTIPRSCLVAISGPMGTAMMGVFSLPIIQWLGFPWWVNLPWLYHALFLVPLFGDGKSLVMGLRALKQV